VVLAGDVFYNGSMAATVMPCLERALHRGARVLVGDPGRTDLPRSRLETVATYQTGLAATLVDAERQWVHVLELAGPAPSMVH
jgi:predicted nicotinamide N-methyase